MQKNNKVNKQKNENMRQLQHGIKLTPVFESFIMITTVLHINEESNDRMISKLQF